MTNELEKQFFDTFGIEPKEYKACDSFPCGNPRVECENCKDYKLYKTEYPQITNRILLELICILGSTYICVQDRETLKEHILVQCMNKQMYSKDIKYQVRTLFEEE